MKKIIVIILFLLFSLKANGSTVLFIAPLEGSLSNYAEDVYNGMNLFLKGSVNLVEVDSNSNVDVVLKKYKPEIIIGPFLNKNVSKIVKKVCNEPLDMFLPFSKDTDNCSNVFFFGYDPLQAAKEIANNICDTDMNNIAVFYSYNKLNMAEKDRFLKDLERCGKYASVISGVPTFFNLMDQFVKNTFDVEKARGFSGLTEGKIFNYSLHLDALVVFTPSGVFSHLLDVIDYYDINPGTVYTSDSVVNQSIIGLSRRILRHVKMVVPYYMCSDLKMSKNFLKSYRLSYYKDPTQFSALGYDIGSLISWILSKGSIKGFDDRYLTEGHLLFFDDKRRSVFNYDIIGYKEIEKCRSQILNR